MIISIRYVKGNWHYELYNTGKSISHAEGIYAAGIAPTWGAMIAALEVHVSELEKNHEPR